MFTVRVAALLVSLVPLIAEAGPKIALSGTVVTPTSVVKSGKIVIDGNTIVCAGSCSTTGATLVETGLDLFAGFVDAHNHVSWNLFPFRRFERPTYNNRYNWRFGGSVFKDFQSKKSALEKKLKCDMTLYGEAMAALGGTTTIVSEDACFADGIRNGESPSLGGPAMKTVGDPLQLKGKTKVFWDGALSATPPQVARFVIHLAEGGDASSLNEWGKLEAMGPPYTTNRVTSIVHGVPFTAAEYAKMKQRGWSIIWSPSSNMRLYQKTTDVVAAMTAGVNVALAPDWNLGGSPTLLQELAYVRQLYPSGPVKNALTAKKLLAMATEQAAAAIGLEKYIGALKKGYRADIVGLRRKAGVSDPYESLLAGDPRAIGLVMVDGKAVVLGPEAALAALPALGACEPIDVCGVQKKICFASSVKALAARVKTAYPEAAPLADCSPRPLK